MNFSGTETSEVKHVCEHMLDYVWNCFAFINWNKIFDWDFYFLPSAIIPGRCSVVRLEGYIILKMHEIE